MCGPLALLGALCLIPAAQAFFQFSGFTLHLPALRIFLGWRALSSRNVLSPSFNLVALILILGLNVISSKKSSLMHLLKASGLSLCNSGKFFCNYLLYACPSHKTLEFPEGRGRVCLVRRGALGTQHNA